MTNLSNVFCIQDRTGTAAQLTLEASPALAPIELGDTGVYTGLNWDGVEIALNFTVGQIIGPSDIGITTMTPTGGPGNVMQSGWPKVGFITWLTGSNSSDAPESTIVTDMHPANAYTTVEYFLQYCNSRNIVVTSPSPIEPIQAAIVLSSDYLDQRYRFKGIKLLQFLSESAVDPMIGFIDPWLMPFGYLGGGPAGVWAGLFSPSTTAQRTQWPRQGVVDYSGDTVYGIPQVLKEAACELTWRSLSGVNLQPDYDPNLVGQGGGVAASVSKEVGPIKVTNTYDTKLGLGFFPDFPKVRRMLNQAGIILGGGGRSIIM